MQAEALLSSKELEQLRLQAQHLLQNKTTGFSPLIGLQHSPYRGSGLELEDLRLYQWGDDVRHIAWRTSARSGQPITKVFREERQERLLIAVEQHPGMAFATQGELKATIAARATALLSFAALTRKAEIGGIISSAQTAFFPYSNRLDNILALLNAATTPPTENSTPETAQTLLTQLLHLKQRGSSIYIISDFQHWNETSEEELASTLKQLSTDHPVFALQIIDKGEQKLPAVGKLRLRSPYSGTTIIIDSDNPSLRQRYQQAMTAKQQQLETLFQRCGINHQRITTDADVYQTIASAYG